MPEDKPVRFALLPRVLLRRLEFGHEDAPMPSAQPQKPHKSATGAAERPVDDRVGKRLAEANALAVQQDPDFIPLPDVLAHLASVGVSPVVIGGPAVGCWTGKPRATSDNDLVIAADERVRSEAVLRKAYPSLEVTYSNAGKDVTRFSDLVIPDEPMDRIDLIVGRLPIYRAALESATEVKAFGRMVRIPSVEALVVLKTAAAVSTNRSNSARIQDQADLAKLIETCPWIREDEASIIARTVSQDLESITGEVIREFRQKR